MNDVLKLEGNLIRMLENLLFDFRRHIHSI